MKKINLTLKCILVMVAIAFVCVALLAVANTFLIPKKSLGLDDKVIAVIQDFCPADSYEDLTQNYEESIEKFNTENSNGTDKVNGVYMAKGGGNDGALIIESEAAGYDKGIVTMLTAFKGDEIMGIGVRTYDPKNSYWKSHIDTHWDNIKQYFIGKSGSDFGNKKNFELETGSTAGYTNGAILNSVTLAARFNAILGGNAPAPETPKEVTDEEMLSKLRAMTGEDKTFTEYPYKVNNEIKCVYVSDSGEIIMDAYVNRGDYGDCELLVLVGENVAEKITLIYTANDPVPSHNATSLFTPEKLNELTDKTVEEINALGHLDPSTGATQSSDGLKQCVKNALKNIDGFLESEWGSEVKTNE